MFTYAFENNVFRALLRLQWILKIVFKGVRKNLLKIALFIKIIQHSHSFFQLITLYQKNSSSNVYKYKPVSLIFYFVFIGSNILFCFY